MQAAEHQIALRSHPQLLLTAHLQGSVGDSDHLADLRDIERFTRIFVQHPAKPPHDQLVLSLGYAVLADLAPAKTADHRLYERLLESMCSIRVSDDFRGLLRQMCGRGVQSLKRRHGFRGRDDAHRIAWWGQVTSRHGCP